MAKRGRPKKNNLNTLIKKPELWIGIFTVGLLLGIVGGLIFRNRPNLGLNIEKESLVSPIPETTQPTPAVQKLAETSSSLEIEVLENESYWKIAKRVCGDAKKNFLTIQELNENIRLYRGMTVKVACE